VLWDVCEGVCKIHGDKMLTFDGLPLLLPVPNTEETSSSRCDVLLAQDCSERGLFSVTGSFKHSRWAVRMDVPSYTIQLIPDRSADKVILKVNDEEHRVHQSQPVVLREQSGDTRSVQYLAGLRLSSYLGAAECRRTTFLLYLHIIMLCKEHLYLVKI
jgi:hypothetical protein